MLVWDALCALNLENFYFFMPSTESNWHLLRGDLCELDLQNLFVDLHALRNHMFCRQVFFDLFLICVFGPLELTFDGVIFVTQSLVLALSIIQNRFVRKINNLRSILRN